jgi:hypothetical protein
MDRLLLKIFFQVFSLVQLMTSPFKYWTEKLKEETSGKTTLTFMSCDHLAIGDSHPVWKLPLISRPEVRKGIAKSRIITGTYILQTDRHKFSQYLQPFDV